jgi:hypothetical protein
MILHRTMSTVNADVHNSEVNKETTHNLMPGWPAQHIAP